ncbi:hypothetical protein CPB86DRAFT_780710 [Serendipita vermifera]|nr:hypothetical protein CPB86DRAFT_780710 [Serendipita vermifera]
MATSTATTAPLFPATLSTFTSTPSISPSPTDVPTTASTSTANATSDGNQALSFVGPLVINYCEQVVVGWVGGVAPYTIRAIDISDSEIPNGWSNIQNDTVFQFFNNEVLPGNEIKITIQDNQAVAQEKSFTVAGDATICTATTAVGTVISSTSLATARCDNQPASGALSSGIIVGIVIAASAFLLVVGMAIWFYRGWTASRPKRVIPYNLEHKNAGDRSSIISGRSNRSARSARSVWSTFSGRVGRTTPAPSVEDGVRVEIDTVQVIEEARSPMTGLHPSDPLFTSRRTTREWTGYPMKPQGRSQRMRDITESFGPSTVMTPSQTSSQDEPRTMPSRSLNTSHTSSEDMASPFADRHGAAMHGSDSKAELGQRGDSSAPSEADATQLSRETLEALADIVAARLHQRSETAPVSNTRTSQNGTELPPRYY